MDEEFHDVFVQLRFLANMIRYDVLDLSVHIQCLFVHWLFPFLDDVKLLGCLLAGLAESSCPGRALGGSHVTGGVIVCPVLVLLQRPASLLAPLADQEPELVVCHSAPPCAWIVSGLLWWRGDESEPRTVL